MFLYRLLKPGFILWYLISLYVAFVLFQYEIVGLSALINNKASILLFVLIYFLVNINRIIRFPYFKLISIKSIFFVYIRTIGIIFFIVSTLSLLIVVDFQLMFRELLAMITFIAIGSFVQKRVEKNWKRYFVLSFVYVLIIWVL
jgi:cation transport ATPase